MKVNLKLARVEAGLTQEQLAEKMGVSRGQVARIESGKGQPSMKFLETAAGVLDVPLARFFRDFNTRPQVPIRGHVGAGEEVLPIDDVGATDEMDFVDAPPGLMPGSSAAIVTGMSMYPFLMDRDIIIHGPPRYDIAAHYGLKCIVKLADGRMFVKILRPGSRPGYFNLESFNFAPMQDVVVEWVAIITHTLHTTPNGKSRGLL